MEEMNRFKILKYIKTAKKEKPLYNSLVEEFNHF